MNQKLPLAPLIVAAGLLLGCDAPAPVADPPGPPPPPPVAPAPKPVEPPPKPAPDRYKMAVDEMVKVLQRYPKIYAEVRDAASADKAAEEIGRLTARLRELAAELAKLPARPGQEQHLLPLQAELTTLPTAQLANPDMQRVFADADLQLRLLPAHQAFLLEGLGALAPAILARQANPPSADAQPIPPPAAQTGKK